MNLRIATIFLRHGENRYPDALATLNDFYRRQLPGVTRTTIIVDNALPRRECRIIDPETLLVGGDNTYWEFSGWDRGLAQLDRLRGRVDLVHFVTSAFDMLYTDFIALFDAPLLAAAAANRAAVGHIDHRQDPMGLFDRSSDHWIRTSFFFLPPVAIDALHSMVSCQPSPEVFTADHSQPFHADAPISEDFQHFILSWLTGKGTGQGVTWHSRFDLDAETLGYFREKATTLFNEALLTVRLQELGYPVVDVTWLADELSKSGTAQIDWKRHWRDQLERRL